MKDESIMTSWLLLVMFAVLAWFGQYTYPVYVEAWRQAENYKIPQMYRHNHDPHMGVWYDFKGWERR